MADGTLKVGTITNSAGSGNITIGSGVTLLSNVPAFLAFSSADQGNLSDNVWTKVQFNSEKYDTDNTYDNSTNYRFTPGVAGKYRLYSQVGGYGQTGGDSNSIAIRIYKNGTDHIEGAIRLTTNILLANNTNVITIDATIESDADDYFEVYFAINTNGGTNATIDYNATKLYTYFGGYRIGA